MKPNLNLRPPASQRGVATLMIALVLLLAATFITVYSARVGLNEQRMAANDSRAKESFQNAEGGLEYAKSWLLANQDSFSGWVWSDCVGGETELPCGYAGDIVPWTSLYSYVSMPSSLITELNWTVSSGPYVYTQSPGASEQPLVMAARGNSLDTTGEAFVKQAASKFSVLNTGPVPPVMAPVVEIGGSMTILANPDPDQGGVPIPLTVWSNNDFAGSITSSAFSTCAQGDFRNSSTNVQCIGPGISDGLGGTAWDTPCGCIESYSEKSGGGGLQQPADEVGGVNDIVDNDPDFPYIPGASGAQGDPESLFTYIFSRESTVLKGLADYVVPDCSSLVAAGANATGLWWVEGECNINGGTVGSRTDPVIIVAEGGLKFNGGPHIWGLVYGMDRPYQTYTFQNTGTSYMHGALVFEGDMDHSAGTFNAMYDPEVFAAFSVSTTFNRFGLISGSWFDGL